jgi:TatD DNase family protein
MPVAYSPRLQIAQIGETKMLFDTHAHYDDEKFNPDREAVLLDMKSHNVGLIVNPGCDLPSSQMAVALAEQYPFVYAAVGIHPENCQDLGLEAVETIRTLSAHPKVKAIGEIGLDYYWEETPEGRAHQREFFRAQLALAQELNLPVIVHDRDAHHDSMEIVRKFPQVKGVFHCYAGSTEDAKMLVRMGWMLSFNGVITFKNARKALEVIRQTPMEHLMIETDSPYLAPVPFRGQRNDSRNVHLVAEKMAELKGISVEEVERITAENGKHFFHIP